MRRGFSFMFAMFCLLMGFSIAPAWGSTGVIAVGELTIGSGVPPDLATSFILYKPLSFTHDLSCITHAPQYRQSRHDQGVVRIRDRPMKHNSNISC